jgi:two-component system CheB/CheR fusion protein
MSDTPTVAEFEALLGYLKRNRGFDFSGYKPMSLMRRIRRRMQVVGIENYSDYLDHLEVHPDEFVHLFNTILINVTGFFRDQGAWNYVSQEVLPRLLVGKIPAEPLRIWSAGCASGEEAYSLAMLLAEAMGIVSFRERVKIYATDVDEEALTRARYASYTPREAQGVPAELLERYFEGGSGRYLFNRELRRNVIFGRHDLLQDAPISRIDLLVCRNTLMYFNADAQSRILARFHFALNDIGTLFLGKAEMLLTHGSTFTPLDLKRRVFAKVPKINLRDRLLMMAQAGSEDAVNHLVSHVRLRDSAFDEGPVAQVVIDAGGYMVLANERARRLFGLTPRDQGRPIQDLELSYRPVSLRPGIDRASAEGRPISLGEVELPYGSGPSYCLEVHVSPLMDASTNVLGALISFDDITRYKRLQEELKHSNEELETAYEELQSTNEELETMNEELQSTIEELETTNEELQSTNEELETMNEELQSTNEELQTINEELRRRSVELNRTNSFLASILASLRGAVAVVDQELQVLIWNHKAEDLWGLRVEEALGRHLLNLDIGLPVERLSRSLRECLSGESQHAEGVLEATNRRGRTIQCRVTETPLVGAPGQIDGVILLMEEVESGET